MMRPPMQKTALQQNEANRLQHHQQQSQLQQQQSATVHLIPHKHLQQQQQPQQHHHQQLQTATTVTPTTASNNIVDCSTLITATTAAARKSQKLEQHELLVENHLNNACFAQVQHPPLTPQSQSHLQHQITGINTTHSILQQQHKQQQQQLAPCLEPLAVHQPSVVFYNEFYQHLQQPQQQQRPSLIHRGGNIDDTLSSVKLLDLSTSPPGREDSHTSVFRTPVAESREVFHNRQTPLSNSANSQRFSYTSQYSRSSSSDDSSSLSLSTACGSIGGGGVVLQGTGFTNFSSASAREHSGSTSYNTGSTAYNSYSNTFDDAAENFIINFPADTTPTQPLPPLIPGRGASSNTTGTSHASDFPQQQPHNYCLPLSETEPLLTNIEATVKDRQRSIYLNKNSASLIFTKKDLSQTAATYQQQQQQYKLQSKTNNNFNGGSVSTTSSSSNTSSSSSSFNTNSSVRRSLPHSTTLRSFSEENYSSRRKPTKHLPATYHQQHRRSLQLNYNNNLVTTSTCGSTANNNHHQHCCNISGGCGTEGSNTNSAVLHKPHPNNHNYQQQQQQTKLRQQQQQQSSGYTLPSSSNNTATATRKQYAYSWYAPVYSALEEELEHDSRDSSPIHNLATTKKSNIQQYHRQHDLNSSSLTAPATDNERESLLESSNNINIHTHLPTGNHKRGGGVGGGGGGGDSEHLVKQLNPSKLVLQHTKNSSVKGGLHTAKGISLNTHPGVGAGGDIAAVEGFPNYDLVDPHAGSLGLAGGPQPRRIRFGNFLKSLVGLRPSVGQRTNGADSVVPPSATSAMDEAESVQIPSSPEITITRTPSDQNMVFLRDPSGRQDYNVVYSSREKLAKCHGDRALQTGSTSSLNVMQQKLWNIMRREGSAISLHQEKSQSIVHYTGLRKCETVIALTRQTSSPCSPTLSGCGVGGSVDGRGTTANKSQQRLSHTGSGIFSASGVEQIRPLNRLRNSVSSMNNTCSRCSSLLSLAASTSRVSLNNGTLFNLHPHHTHQHHNQQQQHQATHFPQHQYQHQRYPSNLSSSNVSSTYSHSRDGSLEAGLHFAVKRNSRTSFSSTAAAALGVCQRNSNITLSSSRTPSLTSPTITTASTIKLTTPPPPPTENSSHLQPSPAHLTLALALPATAPFPVPTASRAEDACFLPGPMERTMLSAPLTVTSLMKMPTPTTSKTEALTKLEHPEKNEHRPVDGDVIDGISNNDNGSSAVASSTGVPTNVTPSTSANALVVTAASALAPTSASASASSPESIIASILLGNATTNSSLESSAVASHPFELFTCKLCLIDVEDASNSTVLHQCGCQFCTECMKAYVEFEISEGAYEISCPDAQCPELGAMTLPEIAILTTINLMKKHHRYRLNREIELDKTRTWCPRAGCETVCLIGATSTQSDGDPSASTSAAAAATSTPTANFAAILSPSLVGVGDVVGAGTGTGSGTGGNIIPTPLQCAVQCPSCKDEFCSACKKTWHPNITCEEHSRRLAADGQDDIGIPFDNDLIKCCPMCAVPIEKDEGCAQMMCKRCKHVFCWYCLASLDDDFLLRHYDKGPCKNKLGHSRASVVWHRAQVIGIFAGFGILLLVASPLLLLAAPCIICCKCRSCSGSKIDEGDGDMDEATALQSLN